MPTEEPPVTAIPPTTGWEPVTGRVKKDHIKTFFFGGVDILGNHTDVMMLVSFNTQTSQVNVLQIPRDSYIILGNGYQRINVLYAVYGVDGFMEQLQKIFGVEIDNYFIVKTKGFRQIIDIIGGVKMNVPYDMNYDDEEQGLSIHLKAGMQTLNGVQAEGFVRFRKSYIEGDQGRMKAQRLFFAALTDQLLDSMTVEKVTKMLPTIAENLRTDCSVSQMISYATAALKVDMENIHIYTVPGEPSPGHSFWMMYGPETINLINKYFNPYTEDILYEDVQMIEFERQHEDYYPKDGEGQSMVDIQQDPDLPIIRS